MKNLFLVDTENVNDYSFLDYMRVSCDDSVILFHTDKSKSIPIRFFEKFVICGCGVEFIKVNCGRPHQLDFQLCSLLGVIIGELKEELDGLYVVSDDKGYLSSIELLSKLFKDLNIKLLSPNNMSFIGINGFESYDDLLEKCAFDPIVDKFKFIGVCKSSHNANELHNSLVTNFSNGREIYKALKGKISF